MLSSNRTITLIKMLTITITITNLQTGIICHKTSIHKIAVNIMLTIAIFVVVIIVVVIIVAIVALLLRQKIIVAAAVML